MLDSDIEPGSILRGWTRERIEAELANASEPIREALRAGSTEKALVLISRKIGLRIARDLTAA